MARIGARVNPQLGRCREIAC